jgi:hypothetical protein
MACWPDVRRNSHGPELHKSEAAREKELPMIARLTLSLLVLSLVASAQAAEPLRYTWQPDQQFIYEVQITVDLPNKVDTLQGTITYQVKSADSPLRLAYRGGLKTSSKDKPGRSSAPASPSRRPGAPHPPPVGGRMLGPGGRLAQAADQLQGLTTTTNQISLTPTGEILELQGNSQWARPHSAAPC